MKTVLPAGPDRLCQQTGAKRIAAYCCGVALPQTGWNQPPWSAVAIGRGTPMAIANEPPRLETKRRYPHGAEIADGGTAFRVWAPEHSSVTVVVEGSGEHQLQREDEGYFSALVPGVGAGARYRLRLDGGDELLADPASRWQPEGPDEPSVVVDPHAFRWSDKGWRGLSRKGQVIYELHVGTFTPEGTWAAAIAHLGKLQDLGITAIQMLPAFEFMGEFGWGYDVVLPYAPTHLYGTPEGLRRFVDAAHAQGLGVILDLVHNHFGRGNRFERFSPRYFNDALPNEWGRQVSFDALAARGAREFFVANALYWIEEFHADGFRFDAAHAMHDDGCEHILTEIVRRSREAAGDKELLIIAEDEPQQVRIITAPNEGGHGLDAVWNEDFHHTAMVAATGRNEAYQHDHNGAPQEFIGLAKYGFLFQGQRYDWQDKPRGTPALTFGPEQFVNYLQNHDQVANSASGLRFWQRCSPARARAITALFLLLPQTPMLFQGQEFAASTPFFYFLDKFGGLEGSVKEGREQFLEQFPSLRDRRILDQLPLPHDGSTFERSKLDWRDYDRHQPVVALHRDLIGMRRSERAFSRQPSGRKGEIDGAVIGPHALILRYFADNAADERLVAANLGADLPIRSIADPLAAPPAGFEWWPIWSTGDPRYGGEGQRDIDTRQRWTLSADTVLVFAPRPKRPDKPFDKEAERARQQSIF
jgi:maltooligosyltrehalose trehalohydrolase